MTIKIRDDYWHGTHCVEDEMPWLTPEAIDYLDKTLKKSDTVLEVGTGGSTLFFARRCRKVFAVETNHDWFAKMQKVVEERGLDYVTYIFAPSQMGVEAAIESRLLGDITIASVDSVHGFDRSAFLRSVLANRGASLKTLILDNYGEQVLFPDHFDKTPEEMIGRMPGTGWRCMDFDDSHWCGRGTRILTRELV